MKNLEEATFSSKPCKGFRVTKMMMSMFVGSVLMNCIKLTNNHWKVKELMKKDYWDLFDCFAMAKKAANSIDGWSADENWNLLFF